MRIIQTNGNSRNMMLYLLDILSLLISYVFAGLIWLFAYKKIASFKDMGNILQEELGILLVAYGFVIIFFSTNGDFIKRGKFEEFKHTFKINVFFTAIYGMILFVTGNTGKVSRGVFVLTPVFNFLIMYIFHLSVKAYLKHRKNEKKTGRMLVITTYDKIENVINDAKDSNDWKVDIAGIILIDKDFTGTKIEGIPVVGNKDCILEYCRTQIVDEVLVNLDDISGDELKTFVMNLQEMGMNVHLSVGKLAELTEFNKSIGMVGDIPVITCANVFHDENKLLVKRFIDITGAIVGLVITGIISVFLIPILCIESPGTPIFKQKRVGKNGRFFYIYKFRSMYKDAEERKKELMDKNEMNGLMFKMTNDPRITKVGKFIRKTSIDELPQFFNVLKGDMSLVGTRPPTVDEFEKYEGHHKRRLSMKPGITGLWQVSGRSDIEDFEEVVKLDLEYIDNWSLGLDLKIILKTIGVIFVRKGAK